jgi:hypothetical protein
MASSKVRGEREPEAYLQGYVEDSFEPRTKIGKRRVLARRGWAGEMMAIFTILLEAEKRHHGKTHEQIIDGVSQDTR